MTPYRLPLIFALALTAAAPAAAQEEAETPVTIEGVPRVLDGGTIEIGDKRIRLFGIDAPEMRDARGPISRAALDDLIAGAAVICTVLDTDRYNRPVARCDAGGGDLGDAMVRAGWAFGYRTSTSDYDAAEAEARAAGRGFWKRPAQSPTWTKTLRDLTAPFALLAALIALAGAYWLRQVDRRHARRDLAASLAGEIAGVMRILSMHDFIGEFDKAIAGIQSEAGQNIILLPSISNKQDFFAVYSGNAGRLGLLLGDLPEKIASLYVLMKGMADGFQSFRAYDSDSNMDLVKRHLEEMRTLFDTVMALGEDAVRDLSAVAGREPPKFEVDE